MTGRLRGTGRRIKANQPDRPGYRGQVQFGQPASAGPGQVAAGPVEAEIRHHRVDPVLLLGAQPDQPGPVPQQRPQLPDRRRGDPRLREQVRPQQLGQDRGVDLVFSELGNDLGIGRVAACLVRSGVVGVAGWVRAGAAGGVGEGGDAELDGLVAASGDLSHLGEFGAGAGEADL